METVVRYTGIGLAGGLLMLAFTWLVFQAMDKEAKFSIEINRARAAKAAQIGENYYTPETPLTYALIADARGAK